jgi:hypothetical protein
MGLLDGKVAIVTGGGTGIGRAVSLHPSRTEGLVAHYELDGNFSDISGHYHHGHVVAGDPGFDPGMVGKAVYFDGDTEVAPGIHGTPRSSTAIESGVVVSQG